jgi:hypothetical protein
VRARSVADGVRHGVGIRRTARQQHWISDDRVPREEQGFAGEAYKLPAASRR